MAADYRVHFGTQSRTWNIRTPAAGFLSGSQRNSLDLANWRPMSRYAEWVSAQKHLPSTFLAMDRNKGAFAKILNGSGPAVERTQHRVDCPAYEYSKKGHARWASLAAISKTAKSRAAICPAPKLPPSGLSVMSILLKTSLL